MFWNTFIEMLYFSINGLSYGFLNCMIINHVLSEWQIFIRKIFIYISKSYNFIKWLRNSSEIEGNILKWRLFIGNQQICHHTFIVINVQICDVVAIEQLNIFVVQLCCIKNPILSLSLWIKAGICMNFKISCFLLYQEWSNLFWRISFCFNQENISLLKQLRLCFLF